MKYELTAINETYSLEELISLAVHLDKNFSERRREKAVRQRPHGYLFPLQSSIFCCFLTTSSLLGAQHCQHLCSATNQPGEACVDRQNESPEGGKSMQKQPGPVYLLRASNFHAKSLYLLMSYASTNKPPTPQIQHPGMIKWSFNTLPLQVLVDCGANDNFTS